MKEIERGIPSGGHVAITYGGVLLYFLIFLIAKPAKQAWVAFLVWTKIMVIAQWIMQ